MKVFIHLDFFLTVEKQSWELFDSKFFTKRAVFKYMPKGYRCSEMGGECLEKRWNSIFVSKVKNFRSVRVLLVQVIPVTQRFEVDAVQFHERSALESFFTQQSHRELFIGGFLRSCDFLGWEPSHFQGHLAVVL
jgi:hypothetical protein